MKGNGSFFPCVKFENQGKLFGKFLLAKAEAQFLRLLV